MHFSDISSGGNPAVVEAWEAGYTASELENVLHVVAKAALVKLVRDQRLSREEVRVGGRYLYLSPDASTRR